MTIFRLSAVISLFSAAFLQMTGTATPVTETLQRSEADTTGSAHSFYTGFGLGSNMVYLGTSISGQQPYEYAAVTYGLKDELFASASVFHFHETDPFLAFYNASLNYSHVVNDWFDFSATISGFYVPEEYQESIFSSFGFGDITLGFDWKLLYTKVSASCITSSGTQVYFSIRNSRYFETSSFLGGKGTISFDPYLNTLFGTMVKVESPSGSANRATPAFKPWMKTTPVPGTTYYYIYGPLEIDLGVPVAFNYDTFTVEAEPCYVFPFYSEEDDLSPGGFVFNLSIIFRIF